MRVILCENYEELSKQAAKLVASQLTLKPDSTLGLATGSTPIGLYNNLIELNKSGDIDFSKVYAYHSFVSSQSGQVCVSKDEELVLLDDTNDYWWLVKCVRSDEVSI